VYKWKAEAIPPQFAGIHWIYEKIINSITLTSQGKQSIPFIPYHPSGSKTHAIQ